MTPDERNLLTGFLGDLTKVTGAQKDTEAAGLIAQAMAANPDAAYLLVQHAVIADQALAAAQARIAELERAVRRLGEQPQSTPAATGPSQGGFLGGLFGGGQQPPPAAVQQGPWGGPQPSMVTPQLQPQQAGFFGGGAPSPAGGMSSFLRSAATTAAGVAGGAFLFEGVSNLFGGQHGGGGFLGGGGGEPREVVNNYYGDQLDGSRSGDGDSYDTDNGDFGGDDHS